MKLVLALLIVQVFCYECLSGAPVALQGGDDEDGKIIFPTEKYFGNAIAESTTTVSTTTVDLGSRHVIDFPENCESGEIVVDGKCREDYS